MSDTRRLAATPELLHHAASKTENGEGSPGAHAASPPAAEPETRDLELSIGHRY